MEQQIKKKPGRPKLQPLKKIIIEGVSEKPANVEDVVELSYSNPKFFKKLFKIFKEYEILDINIIFDKTKVKFIPKNENINIILTIICKNINFYYCAKPLQITVMRESLEKILTFNKKNFKVSIIVKAEELNCMIITVKDFEYDSTDQYKIDVSTKDGSCFEQDKFPENEIVDYPIKFALSSNHLKKKINDIQKISPMLSIQKNGSEHIQFTFVDAKQINYNGIYSNDEKIKLESNIKTDDVFLISVCIGYIKPYTNSIIGEETIIKVDQNKKLALETILDKNNGDDVATLQIYIKTNSSK